MPNPESFGEQFGISRKEQNEMAGRAMGEHLWDELNKIVGEGGLRALSEAQALSRMRDFPAHMVEDDTDESGEPDYGVHVNYKHPSGWSAKWAGGPYIDMHHPLYGPVDIIDITDSEGNIPNYVHPEGFKRAVNEWVQNFGNEDYR